jgi:hypothetical protein
MWLCSLTSRDIKSRKKKFSVADSAFATSRITDHTSEKTAHKLDVLHELLRRHILRQSGESSICCLQDGGILIVKPIYKLSEDEGGLLVEISCLGSCTHEKIVETVRLSEASFDFEGIIRQTEISL